MGIFGQGGDNIGAVGKLYGQIEFAVGGQGFGFNLAVDQDFDASVGKSETGNADFGAGGGLGKGVQGGGGENLGIGGGRRVGLGQ